MNYIVIPALDCEAMTLDAIDDCLAQTVPTRVLVVNQGSCDETRARFEALAERIRNVLVWTHDPPLPSLSATWNHALDFVWECGETRALVINNDVRLHRETIELLDLVLTAEDALFVTGIGVGEDQFDPACVHEGLQDQRGGPDFSCFLITRACHEQYRFDEGFIPCYGEDCDMHRRMMLGGDGDRIFGINLPFHHLQGGSRTINQSTEAWARFERQAAMGRAHYVRKWGGKPNEETFAVPFGPEALEGVTTPELQAREGAVRQQRG